MTDKITNKETQPETTLDYEAESIKLTKNSRGYNWEIKVNITGGDEACIKRLRFLNEAMKEDYTFQGGRDEDN